MGGSEGEDREARSPQFPYGCANAYCQHGTDPGQQRVLRALHSEPLRRRVLSGEFVQVNRHLLRDLIERGLWTEEVRMQLIAHNGSVQNIDLPSDLKELYKTVWEIKQRIVLDMAAARGQYIDQSQSLNIHMVDATTAKLSSMHFHGWQLGLKTGMYYLRTKAAVDAIKFTVEVDKVKRASAPAIVPPTNGTSGTSGSEE